MCAGLRGRRPQVQAERDGGSAIDVSKLVRRLRRPRLIMLVLLSVLPLAPAAWATGGAGAGTFETDMQHSQAGEPYLAVDPKVPGLLLEEDSGGVKLSRDYGHTWSVVSSGNVDSPVAVEPDGTLIAHSSTGSLSGFLLKISKDRGASWSSDVETFQYPQLDPQHEKLTLLGWDRPWLSVDPASGAAYASIAVHTEQPSSDLTDPEGDAGFLGCQGTVFTNAALPCGRRYLAASHDDGQTWGPSHPIDSAEYPNTMTGGFSGIQVAAHGVVATGYYAPSAPGQSCPCLIFETSRDDGAHWARHVVPGASPVVATGPLAVFNDNPGRAPYLYPLIADSPSVELGPYTAADPTHPGRFALLMPDASRTRLLVYETGDDGATWGAPAVLGGGSAAGDTLERPWLSFSPTGALIAFWRDDHGSEGSPYDVYVAVAPSGDGRFRAPVRLNRATAPGSNNYQDDDSTVTADSHYVYATWGDTRADSQIEPWFGSYRYR